MLYPVELWTLAIVHLLGRYTRRGHSGTHALIVRTVLHTRASTFAKRDLAFYIAIRICRLPRRVCCEFSCTGAGAGSADLVEHATPRNHRRNQERIHRDPRANTAHSQALTDLPPPLVITIRSAFDSQKLQKAAGPPLVVNGKRPPTARFNKERSLRGWSASSLHVGPSPSKTYFCSSPPRTTQIRERGHASRISATAHDGILQTMLSMKYRWISTVSRQPRRQSSP